MSNILYIGPYREFSGMGNAARNYIKSLLISGHNISIRPIYNIFKSYPAFDIDNDILELENNFSKKYHTVIQHCYPHQYCMDRRFDNVIGIITLESFNYKKRLNDYLDIPDRLIAPSSFVKNIITESNTKKHVDVVPPPIDLNTIAIYRNNFIPKKSNQYYFYIISDFINKNNILEIVEAFWLIFDKNDNTELVIKTKNKAQEHTSINQVIEYEFAKLNKAINKNGKKPKIIVGETKKEAIYYLHNNNTCFIDMSSGRSFGYSTLEALSFGNQVIGLSRTAQSEIIDKTNNYLVESDITNCKDDAKIYDLYNTNDQRWFKPNIQDLSEKMKLAYMEDDMQKKIRLENSKNKILRYSLESISEFWKTYDI